MPLPESFIEFLTADGYHPRSSRHSNFLCEEVVRGLLAASRRMADLAEAGKLVYALNFTLRSGTADWNVDLVLGTPPAGLHAPSPGLPIWRTNPARIQVAVENKAVMTEHHKAVKNRKRDFEAHHDHVHRYDDATIAGGLLLVNSASRFRSPLRTEITEHHEPRALVDHCMTQMRAVSRRTGAGTSGLDASCLIAVDYENTPGSTAAYLTKLPAPQVGDPLHFDSFIAAIVRLYEGRFT